MAFYIGPDRGIRYAIIIYTHFAVYVPFTNDVYDTCRANVVGDAMRIFDVRPYTLIAIMLLLLLLYIYVRGRMSYFFSRN